MVNLLLKFVMCLLLEQSDIIPFIEFKGRSFDYSINYFEGNENIVEEDESQCAKD